MTFVAVFALLVPLGCAAAMVLLLRTRPKATLAEAAQALSLALRALLRRS